MKDQFSSLIVQALEELGTVNIDRQTESRIKELLISVGNTYTRINRLMD